MLFVLFQLGHDRFALEARRVVEIVPLLALKKIPQSPQGVAGIFVYRGRPVPALDLCELTLGRPAQERLSTRIIIINAAEDDSLKSNVQSLKSRTLDSRLETFDSLVGLIAERATETLQREPGDFVESGVKLTATPFLGPVLMENRGVVQLLHAQKLLTDNLRNLLSVPAAAATP